MTPVTRYLFASRVERETNNDLKSSLIGSDRPNGLYNSMEKPRWSYAVIASLSPRWPPLSDILCSFGVIFAFKESDLRSVKRFPSQQKSSESVKWP